MEAKHAEVTRRVEAALAEVNVKRREQDARRREAIRAGRHVVQPRVHKEPQNVIVPPTIALPSETTLEDADWLRSATVPNQTLKLRRANPSNPELRAIARRHDEQRTRKNVPVPKNWG